MVAQAARAGSMGWWVTPLRPAWLTSRPIAHRGLHDLAAGRPENSLAAFEAAAAAGYPCELDVQLTDSGELIVLHDADLARVTGAARRSTTLTAGDLPRTRLFGGDQHVPTLAQVLERVGGRIPLLIELKRGTTANPGALVRGVLEDLGNRSGQYALSSFDPALLRLLRAERAGYPVGQISGLLKTQGPVRRLAGRTMVGNFLTRPRLHLLRACRPAVADRGRVARVAVCRSSPGRSSPPTTSGKPGSTRTTSSSTSCPMGSGH